MKVVILAGGRGTRISEESVVRPKPMIEIGGRPILWHIMKIYSAYGFHDFVICLGYKGYVIKKYFADYYLYASNVKFDFSGDGGMEILDNVAEPWKVTLIDTGAEAETGTRIRRVQDYIGDETFMLTYGDGVGNVDIKQLLEHHRSNPKAIVTMTSVQPGGRFGVLDIEHGSDTITSFVEKSKADGGWINAGFMVLEPEVFQYIAPGEKTIFERAPLETIAKAGRLQAYRHRGFWQCMDTQRDKIVLNQKWEDGNAPWKVWEK